jgi:uncharacterized protein YuzE
MGKVKDFDPSIVSHLLKLGREHYWVDYDDEADTLYISFRKPQCAKDSVMDGNIIYHYDGENLVGVTVLNATTV